MDTAPVREYFAGLQERIVERLEAIAGARFSRDVWVRSEGGGGVSRVIERNAVFERGGVNFSH
ncbi:MAG: coproporphyrinogen III oxidase, partial [Betaproteobacteria bacterium]